MTSNSLGFGNVSFGAFTGGRTRSGEDTASSVAFSGSLDDVLSFAAKHPDQRDRLDNALMTNGRFGDIYALAQTDRAGSAKPATPRAAAGEAAAPTTDPNTDKSKKKPDYDTPFWTKTRFGDGPTYRARPNSDPSYRISNSTGWDTLIQSGKVSDSEKRVVSRMSDNEGRLDSVQAWDDQIVTAGAMQKTVNPSGNGELAKQVYDFSQSNPGEYKTLFSDRGWTAEKTGAGTRTGDYTMSLTVDGTTMTGKPLNDYIKNAAKSDNWTTALDPLLKAGRDPAFQTKQIEDFVARLDTAVDTTPKSAVKGERYTNPVSDFVTSEQGAALVLDQSVNRPAHVAGSFGKALDSFFAANPKASKDPTGWTTEQRAAYEPQIVANYSSQRNATSMTDPAERATHIVGAGTPLSADPGSFTRVAR